MRPLRFVFNWIAILTLPVWGGTAVAILLMADKQGIPRSIKTGRKWIGEL